MNKFAIRFPILFALVVTLAAMSCIMWPMLLVKDWSITLQIIVSRATICIFAVAMLVGLGWWREVGFRKIEGGRTILPYLPLFILVVLLGALQIASSGIHVGSNNMLFLGLVVYISGAFMEEAVFRGLVLHPLKSGGLLRASIIASILFGLVHFGNLLGGANLNATILQVATATLIGFCFTAPLAITGNIWPLVVIHFLTNFASFLVVGGFLNTAGTSQNPGLTEILFNIVPGLIVAVISYRILARMQNKARQKLAEAGAQA